MNSRNKEHPTMKKKNFKMDCGHCDQRASFYCLTRPAAGSDPLVSSQRKEPFWSGLGGSYCWRRALCGEDDGTGHSAAWRCVFKSDVRPCRAIMVELWSTED
ncbi:hypothetical protein RRG08_039241 [Elysia crispata]|uniref:Uncharacterized protein n=1 Tax=Elysia crispata TaxID=231223 RepID=A0AAE1BDX5_9GAST|nr:hypothetical protein RRG08_039241 [Elysia crispata]